MLHLPPAIARLLDRPEEERRLGPFVLVEPLGRGGFAPVWLAREVYGETALRSAAIKLFSLEPSLDDLVRGVTAAAARARIVEEARALCQVEHPNVVRFYALPIDEPLGVMGLAMEHVAGTSLDARIAAAGRLPVAEALEVGAAIASALSAVHRAGLVHRDVKPSNVIEAAGVVKLIDFGIAAAEAPAKAPATPAQLSDALTDADETLQVAGLQSGTMGYIDPVSLSASAPPSPASDLYALGATLFECLTGKVPAAARTGRLEPAVLTGKERPPPAASLAPDTPPALAELVDSLLTPDRAARPRSAEQVAIRLEQIRREVAGRARALPSEEEGPFRGLGRFEGRDRDVFFGRTRDVAAALSLLRSRGLLALVGPSGSGKSSLARAGVLPALAEGALGGWPPCWDTIAVEPGRDPRAALAAALRPLVGDAVDREPEAVVEALAARAASTGRGLALLIDQLEELATVAEGPSSNWTAELCGRLGEQALPGVRAVVAARRDLLDPLLGLPPLGRALPRGLLLVEPVSALDWSEIVDQALAAYGYRFEDEALRGEVLAELAEAAGAMPLAQFALAALWEKRDASAKVIPRAGLRAVGGVAGALERHADATLLALAEARPDALDAARRVLLSLTTAEGTRAARRREELGDLVGPDAPEVVDALMAARLVVPGDDGLTLAHEALLAQWGRLRGWVAEAREERLLAEELARDTARWRADPEGVALWRRRRLAMAEELRREGGLMVISEDAAAFLRASRRAERRARLLAAGAAALAALSLLGVGAAYVRAVRAEEGAARTLLAKEQESRREAEQQKRRLEEAQARINDLIDQLKREEDKDRKLELMAKIEDEQARVDAADPGNGAERLASAARTALRPRRPPPPAPPPDPSAAVPASAAPAPPEPPPPAAPPSSSPAAPLPPTRKF